MQNIRERGTTEFVGSLNYLRADFFGNKKLFLHPDHRSRPLSPFKGDFIRKTRLYV